MRLATWNLGWILLALAWMGPLPRWAESSFAAHMTLHMLIVAVVAPLLSIAMAGLRFDPVRKAPALFSPIPASVGELLIVWAWHAPGLHHWARHDLFGLIIEQGMFLASGMWVWLSAFGGSQPRSRARAAAGVIGLLLTSMHMTFLGALLALSPRLLYQHHHAASGLTPLVDQHLGGAVMLVVGGIAYLAGGLWLTRDLVREVNFQPAARSKVPSTQAGSLRQEVVQ
ncbi:Cytochrome c oxidase caa3 assembly factor (Caa3_CtaG) [Roseimaritima multifibrata]|uniref:Cytochrome c oxidase caa3 assembly factor (Caa3_CtaG) n=1 Tax=Roseimaritima multifibrata TaxID=1930274 RepID=A0A517MD73_9BACT|nr:cytochrome c oxidase assembly protein [Roseimaritima multifibrata]QDS92839.1 Cytochrome c oxidase caa3 assembly factor (Caa3_CtaG) [Roseimaritima multifibrata]